MLNPARRDGTSDNDAARQMLKEAGDLQCATAATEFAVTHQKSMVIDDKIGFIESLNWETRDLTVTRDYAVENHHESSKSRKWSDASMLTGPETAVQAEDAGFRSDLVSQ